MDDPRRCGARTRSGRPCKKWALANGRCRNHGGASTGPPKGSRNAYKHGAYSRVLTEEEKARLAEIPVGDVEDELRIARLQLQRVLEASRDEDFEVRERVLRTGKDQQILERVRVTRSRSIEQAIVRLCNTIARLESTRAALRREAVREDMLDRLLERLPPGLAPTVRAQLADGKDLPPAITLLMAGAPEEEPG